MANTTLTQTGAQVQADLNKVEGMAEIKSVGSGLSLSNAGELSATAGIPTITIAQSQVISQDPMQVQLTDEQYQIATNNKQIILDGSALGMNVGISNYTGTVSSDGTDYILFTFPWVSIVGLRDFGLVKLNTSTKIGEVMYTTIHVTQIDADGSDADGQVPTVNADNVHWEVDWAFPRRMSYLTTAPTSANTTGTVEIVVLSSEPATRYNGYLYIITGSN